MQIRILVLAANPLNTDHLQLDEEVRAIDQALRQAEFRDLYDLRSHWAVRIEDLQELLLRYQPDIVHFSGHGVEDAIILQNADGSAAPVPAAALTELFRLLKDNIRCIVLNACYSAPQAEAIAENIDVVIGMSDAIGDEAALNFSAAFYRALGFGRSIKTAFDLGCNQINLAGLDQQKIPKLVALHDDPARITVQASMLRASAHYLWALLTALPVLVIVFLLAQALLRWANVDLGAVSVIINLLQIVCLLIVLLGVATRQGRQVVGAMLDNVVARAPILRHTRAVFFGACAVALIVAVSLYTGLPMAARYYNDRGLAALEAGEYGTAAGALETAVRLAPNSGRYYYNLGYAYEGLQRTSDAIEAYQRARGLDDGFWPVYNNLGRLLARDKNGDPDQAVEVLNSGLAKIQQVPLSETDRLLATGVMHKNLGMAYLHGQMPAAALEELNSAKATLETLAKTDGAARLYLADTYCRMADAYQILSGANSDDEKRAAGNCQGFALSIDQGEFCSPGAGLSTLFCLDAQRLLAEATEKNNSSQGDQ